MRHIKSMIAGQEKQVIGFAAPSAPANPIEHALGALRNSLKMDIALISEFIGERQVFRYLDTKTGRSPIKVGDSIALENGYCRLIVEGRMPRMIADTSKVAEATAIAATRLMPIGSHLGVPLYLADGSLYGTLCCFSFRPDPRVNGQHLLVMEAFAQLLGRQLDTEAVAGRDRDHKARRIQAVLESNGPTIVYQPVFRLSDMTIAGAEALARFHQEPRRPPDQWFAEAGETGLQSELELRAIRNALEGFRPIWKLGAFHLSLNSSPETIIGGGVLDAIAQFPTTLITLEVTEHHHVENYQALMEALAPLRARGVRIAVDDAGAGYASMRHVLNIQPDYIKLDISLTRDIDKDRSRRALAQALIEFGRQTDCRIVAEGVESMAEMKTLKDIGAHAAQGYLFSRPLASGQFRPCRLSSWAIPGLAEATNALRDTALVC